MTTTEEYEFNRKILKEQYTNIEELEKKSLDHVLPLFKGESVKQILDTINHSHVKPYSDEEKENTELRIRELLEENHSSKQT